MKISYDDINKIRIDCFVTTEINVKDLLKKVKKVKKSTIKRIWESYLKQNQNPKISLYLHTPFCVDKRCRFCHFKSSILVNNTQIDEYLDYLENEINYLKDIFKDKAFSSVYLGGGTSSIYDFNQIKRLYNLINNNFKFSKNAEISQELSIKTITKEKLRLALDYGFNKFTFGIQSFDKNVLSLANREFPDSEKIKQLVSLTKEYDFRTITGDLIWGLPGDSIPAFYNSVKEALKLNTTQLIIYHFHYSREVKLANKNSPEYFNYIEPYSEKEVIEVLNKLKQEFPEHRFDIDNPTCFIISPNVEEVTHRRRNISIEPYATHAITSMKNSNLGFGTYSRSFIENYFTYNITQNKDIELYYYEHKLAPQILFIIEQLSNVEGKEIKGISMKKYFKNFNNNIQKDFSREIEFLILNKKIKIENEWVIPLHTDVEDLLNIELAFCPEELLLKLKNKTR